MNVHHVPAATRWSHRPVFMRPFPSLLNDLLSPRAAETDSVASRPAINVWSDAAALHVEAELPGLSIDDIELTVLADELKLSGQRTSEAVEGTTMLHRERRPTAYQRRITLPFEVQGDAVTAELSNGVLHVTLPRSENVQPRRVPVRIAGTETVADTGIDTNTDTDTNTAH